MVIWEVRFLPYLQLNNNHKLIYTNKYSTMKNLKIALDILQIASMVIVPTLIVILVFTTKL